MSVVWKLVVRPLLAGEADLHRDIRLRALRESPGSYRDLYDELATMPQQYWQDLTRSLTTGQRQTMLLAELDAKVIGSAYGLFDRHLDGVARLGGMWVAPEVRRHGIGRTLLKAMLAWACNEGYGQMALRAATGRASAAALYADEGFTATGNVDKIRESSAIEIVEMSCVL